MSLSWQSSAHRVDSSTSFLVQVYRLGGIAKLVELLRSTNQNVQRAAAGALRNLVFKNPTNKIETRRQNGIRECVSLLRRTGNTEIQKQLTGTQQTAQPSARTVLLPAWGPCSSSTERPSSHSTATPQRGSFMLLSQQMAT